MYLIMESLDKMVKVAVNSGDSKYLYSGFVRRNVDYFVDKVIKIFNDLYSDDYKLEQFSAWHGSARLVNETNPKSYPINLQTLEELSGVLVIKPGDDSNIDRNNKGSILYYEPDHYSYDDDEYGVTYMISCKDDTYIIYYPENDTIEIVIETFGGKKVSFKDINISVKDFIEKFETEIEPEVIRFIQSI